jgi:hypothetical protein
MMTHARTATITTPSPSPFPLPNQSDSPRERKRGNTVTMTDFLPLHGVGNSRQKLSSAIDTACSFVFTSKFVVPD